MRMSFRPCGKGEDWLVLVKASARLCRDHPGFPYLLLWDLLENVLTLTHGPVRILDFGRFRSLVFS